jgi:hypothetical protein
MLPPALSLSFGRRHVVSLVRVWMWIWEKMKENV